MMRSRRSTSICIRSSVCAVACLAPSIGCASRKACTSSRCLRSGSAASDSTRRRRIIGESALARVSVQRSRISRKAASRVARLPSSTPTYDEKSCIGTSGQRQLDGARRQRRRLDPRQRVQVAALGRRVGVAPRPRAQLLEARLVGAARRRRHHDVEQVRIERRRRQSALGLGDGGRRARQQHERAQQRRAAQAGLVVLDGARRRPPAERRRLRAEQIGDERAEARAVGVGDEAVLDDRELSHQLVEHDVVGLVRAGWRRDRGKPSIVASPARTSAHDRRPAPPARPGAARPSPGAAAPAAPRRRPCGRSRATRRCRGTRRPRPRPASGTLRRRLGEQHRLLLDARRRRGSAAPRAPASAWPTRARGARIGEEPPLRQLNHGFRSAAFCSERLTSG